MGESSRKCGYKRKQKDRERIVGAERLYKDYFTDSPVYNEKDFRRRFLMRRSLFLRIVEALQMNVSYFIQQRDATGMFGLSSLQKVMAAVPLLVYDVAGDVVDEYLRIGASTALECLKIFCRAVYDIFSEQYLRQLTREDVARLTAENARRGFLGMLGSIEFASKDLWIWHTYFGVPGCNNDINVLEGSNLFLNLAKGEVPPVRFEVNGNEYNMRYYLADSIYPSWASFVKTISRPLSQKHRTFARYQEGVRKEVERAFDVLQARWHIVRGPSR
ncbi:uncharacterized protein [Henckelia pumila]|uniref:uncharacterized protein n=1 Tax=Henckelia pumila TaxID=405737 RepID=UPI003C6E9BD4